LNVDFDLSKYSRFLLREDDFLVAMTGQGSVGRIGKMINYKTGYYVNQRVAIVRVDAKKANPTFIFSQIATQENENELFKKANGAGQPNISAKQIGELELVLPDIATQNRIADILSEYDGLIENNQKQIKLLEEAAQRLYEEWFVDLRFPGHENTPIIDGIPQGWRKVSLGDIAPILTGKKDANFGTEDGEYPFFTCSQEPIKAPSYSFDTSAVILAGNGDFNVKLYRGKFEAYQRTYVLSPKDEKYLYLLYNAVNESMAVLVKGASGSTIKFLTKGMIESIPLFVPTDELLTQYNNYSEAVQRKLECLKSAIKNATEARDRLLPKLMSGELEV
jgi:type I restriction enzyme S subunit